MSSRIGRRRRDTPQILKFPSALLQQPLCTLHDPPHFPMDKTPKHQLFSLSPQSPTPRASPSEANCGYLIWMCLSLHASSDWWPRTTDTPNPSRTHWQHCCILPKSLPKNSTHCKIIFVHCTTRTGKALGMVPTQMGVLHLRQF